MSNLISVVQTIVESPHSPYAAHCQRLQKLLLNVQVTTESGRSLSIDEAMSRAIEAIAALRGTDHKVMIIGNGGSAAIASHQAIDWSKNAGVRSMSFNDGAFLTCLGNYFGYENIFSQAVEIYGCTGDILIAISSSGRSPNIINGVNKARAKDCLAFTFAGFDRQAPLLSVGDLNFYVDSNEYGPVEVAHQVLLHYLTDKLCEKRG